MKRLILLAAFLFVASPAYSATNTFPTSGDAGIGTTSPNVPLEVTTNVTALPAPSFVSQVQIGSYDGGTASIDLDSFQDSISGISSAIYARIYGGTNASPTVASGNILALCGEAYNGSGFPTKNSVCIIEATDGTQTTSSAPSNITFGTTPSGSTTRATVMEINNAGNVGIGTTSPAVSLDLGSRTDAVTLPSGTTAQRPTGVAGMVRYNSSNSVPEFYTSSWLPVPLTATSPISINSTTGNITCSTCNTSAANVISVSGDGTFYSNSASTGTVTLTLGNAAAYSVWGNNTSGSGTPAYTTSPELSGVITDLQSIGATSTDGVVVTDITAATSGNQKWSPRVRWTGQGWKTNATAGSQEVDAIAEIQPVQGTANPSFNWVLSGQINGGGYAPLLTVPSGGGLNLNSGVYEINGTQLAASNLLNGVNGSGSIVLTISPTLTTPNIGTATGTSLAVTGNITTSGGQVGIDTTSPVNALDVSGGAVIGTSYAGTDTAPTNGLLVQGNVGIGTSAPSNPLSVNGIIQSLTGGFKFPDGTTQTTASTGSGGMILLATVNASGASSVTFNSTYITSTYNKYVIEFDSLLAATNADNLELQVSSNNGTTWQTSGYSYSGYGYNQGTGTIYSASTTATYIDIANGQTLTNTAHNVAAGTIKFASPSGSDKTMFDYKISGYDSSNNIFSASGGGLYNTAGTINAIKIFMQSGNISGNFHLYGLSGT